MNFILFEHKNKKQSFSWVDGNLTLPETAIAFTYVNQNSIDENGKPAIVQYRIGIPIKFFLGEMYTTLSEVQIHDGDYNNKYCLYESSDERILYPLSNNITVVNNFEELRDSFCRELNVETFTRKK